MMRTATQTAGKKIFYRGTGYLYLLSAILIFMSAPASADELKDCMTRALSTADDATTIGQLRLQCEKEIHAGTFLPAKTKKTPPPLVSERIHEDKEHVLQPFTLMAHKPNYILFAAYNGNSYTSEVFQEQFGDPGLDLDDVEAQFQLSIKFPLLVNLFNNTVDVYAAYANRSF